MNEVLKAMEERRSIRRFKADPVPDDLIDQVVRAGLWAASGMGRQSPVIVVVTDAELRAEIVEANRVIGGWPEGYDPFYGAPVILIVLAPKTCETRVYDGSLTMGNMMLAAHAVGLGSCWIHRAREEFETDRFKKLAKSWGLEGEWEGVAHCALGYAEKDSRAVPRREGRVVRVGGGVLQS